MSKKILAVLIICCFFSNVLVAQAYVFEQQSILSAKTSMEDIVRELNSILNRLDRGETVKPEEMENIKGELTVLSDDINAMLNDLNQSPEANASQVCASIKKISLIWMGIGAISLSSLVRAVIGIINLSQSGGNTTNPISLIRQYIAAIRKILTSSVVVPIALINVLLVSKQYRNCMRTVE